MREIKAKKWIDSRTNRTYYRIRVQRPKQGLNIEKLFNTKREAQQYINDLERRLSGDGEVLEKSKNSMTFSDLVEWITNNRDKIKNGNHKEFSESSWISFRQNINQAKNGMHLGDISLDKLTWDLLETRLDMYAEERNWSPGRRYGMESILSTTLQNALRAKFISRNVIKADANDRHKNSKSRERIIERYELDQLIEAAETIADESGLKGDRMLPIFLKISWQIGNRKSELLKLTWSRVKWIDDDPIIGAELIFNRGTTKTDSTRSAFISKDTAMLLRAHEQEFRSNESKRVFPPRKGKGPEVVWKVDAPFRNARERAGLDQADEEYGEVLTLHHFRHSYATRLGDAGASLMQLMAGGGGKALAMAQRYTHEQKKQAREAATLLLA